MKSFVVSEFGYCPLVWMSHSKKLNSGVNKRYERVLRIYMFYYVIMLLRICMLLPCHVRVSE